MQISIANILALVCCYNPRFRADSTQLESSGRASPYRIIKKDLHEQRSHWGLKIKKDIFLSEAMWWIKPREGTSQTWKSITHGNDTSFGTRSKEYLSGFYQVRLWKRQKFMRARKSVCALRFHKWSNNSTPDLSLAEDVRSELQEWKWWEKKDSETTERIKPRERTSETWKSIAHGNHTSFWEWGKEYLIRRFFMHVEVHIFLQFRKIYSIYSVQDTIFCFIHLLWLSYVRV